MVKNAEFRDVFDFNEMIFGLFDAENVLNCEGLHVRVLSEFFECLELCIAINFKNKLGVLLLVEYVLERVGCVMEFLEFFEFFDDHLSEFDIDAVVLFEDQMLELS